MRFEKRMALRCVINKPRKVLVVHQAMDAMDPWIIHTDPLGSKSATPTKSVYDGIYWDFFGNNALG